MRRAQHADALPAEICERRIHIVASHDDLGRGGPVPAVTPAEDPRTMAG
jgi:hypothetical protein